MPLDPSGKIDSFKKQLIHTRGFREQKPRNSLQVLLEVITQEPRSLTTGMTRKIRETGY